MQYARYRSTGHYSSYFPPGVKWLLIVNVAVYVINFFAARLIASDPFEIFGLVPWEVLRRGYIWQVVTYMFLHGPLMHILINMLTLWMFGVDLERDWGTRRFLNYYFLCGVGAGLCVIAAALLFGGMGLRTIGASGAIYGLLLAFGMLYPDRIVLFSFLFPMKAKYFVIIMGAIAFMSSFQTGSGISHIAHLGGMIFGYVYLKTRLKKFKFNPLGSLRRQWTEWRRQRARRKFQVYMRKHGSDRDRWVN